MEKSQQFNSDVWVHSCVWKSSSNRKILPRGIIQFSTRCFWKKTFHSTEKFSQSYDLIKFRMLLDIQDYNVDKPLIPVLGPHFSLHT